MGWRHDSVRTVSPTHFRAVKRIKMSMARRSGILRLGAGSELRPVRKTTRRAMYPVPVCRDSGSTEQYARRTHAVRTLYIKFANICCTIPVRHSQCPPSPHAPASCSMRTPHCRHARLYAPHNSFLHRRYAPLCNFASLLRYAPCGSQRLLLRLLAHACGAEWAFAYERGRCVSVALGSELSVWDFPRPIGSHLPHHP